MEQLKAEKNKEKNMELPDARLGIEEPDAHHGGWKFSFYGDELTPAQCAAYNRAIQEVCDEKEWQPFHQAGRQNMSEYHMWELWSELSQDQLEEALPIIQERAEEIFKSNEKLGLNEIINEQHGEQW